MWAVYEFPHCVHHAYFPRSLFLWTILPLCGPDCGDACGSVALDAGDEVEVVGVDSRGLHITYSGEAVCGAVPRKSQQERDLAV
jgi:hypothetical protein